MKLKNNQNDLDVYCNIKIDTKSVTDEGFIEGYGAIYGIADSGNDIIVKGAFDESLNSDHKVKMLWQHDPYNPIGVWEVLQSDDKGIKVKGRLNLDTKKGREAHALVKTGAMDGLSIGYRTTKVKQDSYDEPRHILEASLWEISLVTFPMHTGATITGVKTIKTKRDCEKALRDAGFSRKEAGTILSKGYDALNLRDADLEAKQVFTDATEKLKQLIKG